MKERMFQLKIIAVLLIIVLIIGIPIMINDKETQLEKNFQENSTIIKVRKKEKHR